MNGIARLLDQNREWADRRRAVDPQFFERLCQIQRPEYLWIGCSDSRVPANEIVGLPPGEMFVHRNVGNVVVPGDPNGMAAVQYAVEMLGIRDIIVCGHYGCGGVRAALEGVAARSAAHVQRWLAPLAHLAMTRSAELAGIGDLEEQWGRLCEINVEEQVSRLSSCDVLVDTRLRGDPVRVHGWIYDLRDGLLRDLRVGGNASDAGGPSGR